MRHPRLLPVDRVLPDLVSALQNGRAAVLQAPTGSGKTTRVPPALLDAGLLEKGRLVMLQPRRVAARACARAMADFRGEPVGDTIGYQVRFEKRIGRQTKIAVVTEGILTREFTGNPLLEGVSCVVLDEFHERSIHTDLSLALLRELMDLREDLKLVVMSATVDTGPVSRFLFDCPVIRIAEKPHPLTVAYRPEKDRRRLTEETEAALEQLWSDPCDDGGHVLVFLPGAGEIRQVMNVLSRREWNADLVPLHGSLSSEEQDTALAPSQRRRIILATNIAETSLTIPGVTAVIDSGLQKLLVHDPGRAVDRLDLVRISSASAAQRAGRAGRTGPGRVIRLWPESFQPLMAERDPPEIMRADLAAMLLQILDFHGPDLANFPFFEKPPQTAVDGARDLLHMLGAIDGESRITASGKRFAALPLHPRAAVILERAARMGALADGARLCALLSETKPSQGADALFRQLRQRSATDRRVAAAERQLVREARRLWPDRGPSRSLTQSEMARLLLAGYPDRLCRVRAPGQGVMVGGRGIAFDPPTVSEPLFLALDLIEHGEKRTACKASRTVPLTMEDAACVLSLQRQIFAVFDDTRRTAVGVRRLCHRDLVLEEKLGVSVPEEELATVLAEHAVQGFETLFRPEKKARALLFRLQFAARHLPEEAWPDVSEKGLKTLLPELCHGKRSFAELRRIDWYEILHQKLPWPLRKLLDDEVPERIEVPSGSKIAVDYQPALAEDGAPVLAVRIQELFGLADTPRVARARVPVLCHLLAPNMRPAQVTGDLRSFWNGAYAEVRKELRQRYPKHAWPEDPWRAQPLRGPKPKKRKG